MKGELDLINHRISIQSMNIFCLVTGYKYFRQLDSLSTDALGCP